MGKIRYILISAVVSLVAPVSFAAEMSCSDFRPTDSALQRFPDLIGACESVVEREGELYALFRAVVRRASASSVTLYLPAMDHTFSVSPRSDARVLLGGRKARARELQRGQEIRIYLSTSAFATPNVEVALLSETEELIEHDTAPVAALPTTG